MSIMTKMDKIQAKKEKLEKKQCAAEEKLKKKRLAAEAEEKERKSGTDRAGNRKKSRGEKDIAGDTDGRKLDELEEEGRYLFDTERKSVREACAPNGVNPNPLEYMVLNDAGPEKVFAMVLYIHTMPKRAAFASTFAPLFNMPGVTPNVHIEPISTGKATKQLDRRVTVLESENIAAAKGGDTNRQRKITRKQGDAEKWADEIESGNNALFEVWFYFSIVAKSIDELNRKSSDLYSVAREKGIELSACYSVHPEAYLSAAPLNRIYNLGNGLVKTTTIKSHIMDRYSLATIFNHTQSHFTHRNGVLMGYNLHNGLPFFYDPYDKSHSGFGVIFTGKTGTGKSATIKELCSRFIDFGYKIVSIDFDAVGNMGEYSLTSYMTGGAVFQVKNNSRYRINLFELEPEIEFDSITNTEYMVLNLTDKIADMKHIISTMVKSGKDTNDLVLNTFMDEIISDIVAELYAERGIEDQNVESLYTVSSAIINGKLTTGRVKKELPTIKDFYLKVLAHQRENRKKIYDSAYAVIVSSMKKYVAELYYDVDTLRELSAEEYSGLAGDAGRKYYEDGNGKCHYAEAVKGISGYFDGQSTVTIDKDTPMLDIDISQLPEADKPIAQLIVMNYVKENFIKKNSVNPNEEHKLIVLIDEAHKAFPFTDARIFIGDTYRTARKKHVSPWTATQALADFAPYEETRAIIKNSTSKFLLKQDFTDKDYLKKATPLTESEMDELLSLGGDLTDGLEESGNNRKGEICLIDNDRVIFLKALYLKETEARIVETDAANIKKLMDSLNSPA